MHPLPRVDEISPEVDNDPRRLFQTIGKWAICEDGAVENDIREVIV